MSIGAITGLVVLNIWMLGLGVAMLFALRGWDSWPELLRLAGLCYMLAIGVHGVIWTLLLTTGVTLSLPVVIAAGCLVAAAGIVIGIKLGRTLPPITWPRRLPGVSLAGALFGACAVIYLEGLFRAGRLAGLYEFDAWSFWVPKAKAIFFFGGLDQQFLRELPHQSYPPVVPALEAVAFRFMGSADVVTLHLQFWFLLIGFVAAVVGLLSVRVSGWALWPPLLLLLATPHVVSHALQPQADFLLDELVGLAVLLLVLWLIEREGWTLWAAAILLAAAMLTKRDGYLFAVATCAAAAVSTAREPRNVWSRPLLTGAAAVALTLPWRIFLHVRRLSGEGPEAGGIGLITHAGRAWPSLRLTLATLFDFHIWLILVPLFVAGVAVAFAAGERALPSFALVLGLLSIAGLTWTTWAFPSLPISKETLNPIVRLSGGFVISAVVLVPLLLQPGLRARAG